MELFTQRVQLKKVRFKKEIFKFYHITFARSTKKQKRSNSCSHRHVNYLLITSG